MYATAAGQTLKCTQDADATVGNTINGASTGFDVEDVLYHKVDDSSLGLFRGPGTTLYVTPNSGSIQRAIDIANNPYTVTQVNVKDGTYAEHVTVNKQITLNGQGANTIVNPGSGTTLDVTVSGVTISNLHIYLYGVFTPTVAPTATNNTFSFTVNSKVFLQGPFSGGSMTTTLNTSSLIPLSQPYNVAPFNYAGSESVGSIPANVTDWILLELRTGTSSATTYATRAAFVRNDGTVLELDGNPGVEFSVFMASGYESTHYLVVKHRNHLALMSSSTAPYPASYDFTTSQAQGFGTNPMASLSGGVFGLYAGDANVSGIVTALDISAVISGLNGTGYSAADANLSGITTALDINQMISNLNKATQLP